MGLKMNYTKKPIDGHFNREHDEKPGFSDTLQGGAPILNLSWERSSPWSSSSNATFLSHQLSEFVFFHQPTEQVLAPQLKCRGQHDGRFPLRARTWRLQIAVPGTAERTSKRANDRTEEVPQKLRLTEFYGLW